ncbi:MAG: Glycolate dehydrogenase, FAD-binding subunit GlcE [uncultured Rubrobacteraceae bacterium]|uniref:Glycolate dehydrogenase, FAD-binding subunit GlcE n=1 Tax=uncultured Rubrobacteraceae bacterium TaxID=349277 RepID=A0A6J4P6L7_9ACTN|nr:MAG: Glycolate dehydrogenase, FAD-binding subunit GlcE [uncultured Rubrobacteraceae bacterium]
MATRTENVSLEDLQSIVGEEHAREAAPEDAIDGVAPSFVVEPGSTEDVSELMKLANDRNLAVAPRGGGTSMSLGNPPRELGLILSTSRMDAVVEHVPGDQVVRVQSGIRFADLQARLAESDQMLGVDPPEAGNGATVGGIVAANSSGPKRYRYGTIRDLIIGITVVLADGTVAKAGGKVVKNVAGYDLAKLFTGSLGTLGFIAECNFRLHPRPETARTVAVELPDTASAGAASQAILHAQVVPSAVELLWDGETRMIAVLIEGIPSGIEAQAETASHILGSFGEVSTLGDDEAGSSSPPGAGDDGVAVKISAPPAELAGVLDSTLGASSRLGVTPRITGHAGTGVTYVGLSGGDEGARAGVVEELREIWLRRGGSVVVREAPPAFKERVEAWGPIGTRLDLTRRVKEKFDPRGILNPGRFVGGI